MQYNNKYNYKYWIFKINIVILFFRIRVNRVIVIYDDAIYYNVSYKTSRFIICIKNCFYNLVDLFSLKQNINFSLYIYIYLTQTDLRQSSVESANFQFSGSYNLERNSRLSVCAWVLKKNDWNYIERANISRIGKGGELENRESQRGFGLCDQTSERERERDNVKSACGKATG